MIKLTCIIITDTSPIKGKFCLKKMEFCGCSSELYGGGGGGRPFLPDLMLLDMF